MLCQSPPRLDFTVHVDAAFDDGRIDIGELKQYLHAIAEAQSIAQAATALGVTYRTLWGRLQSYDDVLRVRLVGKSRGRGSHLTGKGRALLAALDRHAHLFAPPAAEHIAALTRDLAAAMGEAPMLRLLASHDYAIARVFARGDVMTADADPPPLSSLIHAASAGSDDCIRALLRGDADLAGYHHPADRTKVPANASSVRLEGDDNFWHVAVTTREQGLLVAPTRKTEIRSVRALTRPGVRFVNRQHGSGTRTLFDTLLAGAGVSPTQIVGYDHEEFTHQAVAATIAAGAADAGLGLRAAAAQFRLHFVALTTETYCLAGRRETAGHPTVKRLITSIAAAASALPGYQPMV
jgi:molybdate transport repressor ModE-like protein